MPETTALTDKSGMLYICRYLCGPAAICTDVALVPQTFGFLYDMLVYPPKDIFILFSSLQSANM